MPDKYQKLLDAGMDHLQSAPQQPKQADEYFRQILAKDPKHFLANFGHLVVLHHGKVTNQVRAERLRCAKLVLKHAPKRPRGTLPEFAMRFASNTLAWEMYSGEKRPAKLREALAHAELGASYDPEYDDTHSPVTATKLEILLALGREDEAYRLVQKVLATKSFYKQFVPIARSAAFKRWLKAQPEAQPKAKSGAGHGAEHSAEHSEKKPSFASLIGDDLATERNCAMLAAVERQNENKRHAPMPRAAIDRLRMQKTRGSRKQTVPLPPSLKALLAYDSRLKLRGRKMFEVLDGKTLTSTTMTEVFRTSSVAPAYKDLKKSAEADMPALIEFPLGSDQRVFMYVATPDRDGEYPILRWDDEPCIWISRGCLQDEICSVFAAANATAEESVSAAEKRKDRATKAVAKWLKREPEQRFYESDDD